MNGRDEMKCKSSASGSEIDQITAKNQVDTYGGDKSQHNYGRLRAQNSPGTSRTGIIIKAEKAFVKYEQDAASLNRPQYDIGILISSKPLYDDKEHNRAPICLAKLNAQIGNNQPITTVGWGRLYTEFPDRNFSDPTQVREPESTSCSTDKHGPKYSRFEKCDVNFLKNNDWKCQKFTRGTSTPKSSFPKNSSGHTVYDYGKCKKYFAKAEQLIERETKKLGEKSKWIQGVQNIIIKPFNDEKPIECYRKELFINNGWCTTGNRKDTDPLVIDMEQWGFCDKSCEYAEVI